MRGFIVGLLLGVLGVAGHTYYLRHQASKDPCLGRCGDGTVCVKAKCAAAEPKAALKKKRSRRRRRPRRSRSPGRSLKKPTAAQLRAGRGGSALGKIDYVNMAGELGGSARELSRAEVSAKVRRVDNDIIRCIQRASRGYDLSGRKVRVEVGFRIERSGGVKKVQLKAPRLLLSQGLLGCIRPLVKALVFPESARALVMRYPYALD